MVTEMSKFAAGVGTGALIQNWLSRRARNTLSYELQILHVARSDAAEAVVVFLFAFPFVIYLASLALGVEFGPLFVAITDDFILRLAYNYPLYFFASPLVPIVVGYVLRTDDWSTPVRLIGHYIALIGIYLTTLVFPGSIGFLVMVITVNEFILK